MIIYTDSIGTNISGVEMTPAHVYGVTRDFSTILDEIANGNLPTNTQQPFPVNWSNDDSGNNESPWSPDNQQYYQQSSSFYNPLF